VIIYGGHIPIQEQDLLSQWNSSQSRGRSWTHEIHLLIVTTIRFGPRGEWNFETRPGIEPNLCLNNIKTSLIGLIKVLVVVDCINCSLKYELIYWNKHTHNSIIKTLDTEDKELSLMLNK
jgi:hypothetical protein